MEKESREILINGAKSFGVLLDENLTNDFDLYLNELIKWNQKINLTSIQSEKEIVIKHFLDSLSVIPYFPQASALLDMGSGAGFPGIPIKLVLPSIKVILVDSRLKRVDFQRHIIRKLELKGIEAIHGRIEDERMIQKFSAQFDIVVSRAFSGLKNLLSLGYPYLKKGGLLFAMKGKLKKEQVPTEYFIEDRIQFHLKEVIQFILPFSQFHRTLLIFEKL